MLRARYGLDRVNGLRRAIGRRGSRPMCDGAALREQSHRMMVRVSRTHLRQAGWHRRIFLSCPSMLYAGTGFLFWRLTCIPPAPRLRRGVEQANSLWIFVLEANRPCLFCTDDGGDGRPSIMIAFSPAGPRFPRPGFQVTDLSSNSI